MSRHCWKAAVPCKHQRLLTLRGGCCCSAESYPRQNAFGDIERWTKEAGIFGEPSRDSKPRLGLKSSTCGEVKENVNDDICVRESPSSSVPAANSQGNSNSECFVVELGKNDFLVGRGGHIQRYPGNRRVRELILRLLPVYQRARNGRAKARIAERIVKNTRAYGGRFLQERKQNQHGEGRELGCVGASTNNAYGEQCSSEGLSGTKEDTAAVRCRYSFTVWQHVPRKQCRQKLSQDSARRCVADRKNGEHIFIKTHQAQKTRAEAQTNTIVPSRKERSDRPQQSTSCTC